MANNLRYQAPAYQGVLTGTDGNDVYQGTVGPDTAQFDAGRRGAVIAQGATSVTSTAGTDQLNSVETLLFIDGRQVYDAADATAQVLRLYDVVLGRDVDQGGLNLFTQVLDDGGAARDVAASLISSGEFSGRFGAGLSDTQFVEALYVNMRGAPASSGEVAGWATLLQGGELTRADVAVEFANSAESLNNTAATLAQGIWDRDESAISIANLYDTAFNRLADTDGLAGWVSAVHRDNLAIKDVATSFLNSDEAAGLRAADDASFINAVYQNALNRAAEAEGLTGWMTQLNNGATRADVLLAISDSAEHQQITAELVQSSNPLNYGITLIA